MTQRLFNIVTAATLLLIVSAVLPSPVSAEESGAPPYWLLQIDRFTDLLDAHHPTRLADGSQFSTGQNFFKILSEAGDEEMWRAIKVRDGVLSRACGP